MEAQERRILKIGVKIGFAQISSIPPAPVPITVLSVQTALYLPKLSLSERSRNGLGEADFHDRCKKGEKMPKVEKWPIGHFQP